ncbi:MAG: protein kinase [Oscillospiraceae bacterium]|nr:protein kinase [Oscillospiraceae bacterium]
MNLKKCDSGHFYDAERFDICPHCYNSTKTENDDKVGGIVMRKCMWCGAENAVHYSEKICPSCHNNLDGSHNEIINNAIIHFENGKKYFLNKDFVSAEKEFLDFLRIEDSYNRGRKYNMLVRSRTIFEQELIELVNDGKSVFYVSVDIDYAYYALGVIEAENKNLSKARDYLRKAVEWNPFYVDAYFEYAETFKMEGNLETFYTVTNNTYDKIFLPSHLARYYRNLGYYFIEKENYNLATCLLLYSLSFEETDKAKNEIMYIKQISGSLNIPEPDVTKQILEKNNIPTFISERCYALLDKHGLLNKKEEHFCPQCGENVNKDDLFCSKCGMNLKENEDDTLAFCPICSKGMHYGDTYCRNCGSKIALIHTEEPIIDENDIENAQKIIEKLIRLCSMDFKDEYHLSMLLELIKYVPLYLPVNIDVGAMLGGKNPSDLKIGDNITLSQDVKAEIATVKTDEFEIIPLFTKSEYSGLSVMRFYPSDYLPIITKMNMPAVINAFSDYKFALPERYLKNLFDDIKAKESNKPQNKTEERKKYCSSCGAEFDNDAEFCAYCGSKTEIKAVPNTDDENFVINNRYSIIKKIAENNFNNTVVYLAMDTRLNKIWAVKAFDKRKILDSKQSSYQLNAFISQAEFLKKFNHPSIARVVDIIENDDYAYTVMDYIEGENLQTIFNHYGPLSENLVIEWAKQVADILIYLSTLNPKIVHRDIKPHNLILKPDDSIILMDFTIAREYIPGLQDDEEHLGTKGFAAPEQYGGKGQTDCRTDIFGLGMTMYYLLTGIDPANSPYEIPLIRVVNPKLSKGAEYIVNKCIQIEPADRYQTPNELLNDLNNINALPPKKGIINKLFK